MPHILFITTHNLATNPRLVKEIQLALENGFTVEIICFTFRNWSYEINKEILEGFKKQLVTFHCIEAGKEGCISWLISVFKEKYQRFVAKLFNLKARALATAVSRRNYLMLEAVNKVKRADWIIGHNPGALYATQFAAKKLNAKSGFDVEDYHPGEGQNIELQKLTKKLMQEVLPTMDYVSFAAPLIRAAVKEDLGKEGANWITVLNYFPAEEFVAPQKIEGPLKLVWFSQNIAAGRGLEFLLPALKNFSRDMELHLYGNLDASFYETQLRHLENVIVHKPVPQIDLYNSLSRFDIGLALEPKKDVNNDLAISNKLLAYMQAGLSVLASNTTAQLSYLKEFENSGIVLNILNKVEIDKAINYLVDNKDQIRASKNERFNNHNANWEMEANKLFKNWQ